MVSDRFVARTRRNAAVGAATAVALGVLFLFPTSLDRLPESVTAAAPTSVLADPAGGSKAAPGTATGAVQVVTGAAASTRFGPVQVQLEIRGDTIVSATAVTYPQSNRRDIQINSYAVPILESEAIEAQNADIDTVSGATYTSVGYRQSLQAALDAA